MRGYLTGGPYVPYAALDAQLSPQDVRKLVGYRTLTSDILKTSGGPSLVGVMQTQTHHVSSALEPDETQ